MLSAIIKSEFLQSFQSHRFTVILLICCTLMPLSVLVMLLDYSQRYRNFNVNRNDDSPLTDSFVVACGPGNTVNNDFPYPDAGKIKRPAKLSVLAKGTDDALGGTFVLGPRWLDPLLGMRQERNIFAILFGSFDLLLVTKLALGLLATIFGSGAVVSERETGTLALIFSNQVGRSYLMLGKLLGGGTVVITSYMSGLLLCLLLLAAWPDWGLGATDLAPVSLLFASLLLYVIFCYLLGVTISCTCRTIATASITAVAVWLLLIVLLPALSLYWAQIACNAPTSELLKSTKIEAARAILDQAKSHLTGPNGYDLHFGLPNYRGPAGARVEYQIVEAIGALEQEQLQKERQQITLASFLQMFTPGGALTNVAGDLAGTSTRSYLHYRWAALQLRSELYHQLYPTIDQLLAVARGSMDPRLFLWAKDPNQEYLKSLNLEKSVEQCLANPLFDHSSRPWRWADPPDYDFIMKYQEYFEGDPLQSSFPVASFVSLLVMTFLCFGAAFCLIMKYDVRVA